jgi:hypothetical protein
MKRFGAYDPNDIKNGFYIWKSKHQQDLLVLVEQAINTGKRLDLCIKPINDQRVNIDTKNKWKDEIESRVITDGYMDNLIKDSNCESLLDLVFKNKKS